MKAAKKVRRRKYAIGKRLGAHYKQYPFELSLEYSGGHWPDLDKLLRRLAKRLGAKEGGSGFSFMDGQRDIQLFFPDKTSRREFQDALRSLSSIFVTIRDKEES